MEWEQILEIRYNELDPEKRQAAADFLRAKIEEGGVLEELRERIAESPNWLSGRKGEMPLHHGWGTGVRNALRRGGFGEEYFGIDNLDDYYSQLVELAVGARDNNRKTSI